MSNLNGVVTKDSFSFHHGDYSGNVCKSYPFILESLALGIEIIKCNYFSLVDNAHISFRWHTFQSDWSGALSIVYVKVRVFHNIKQYALGNFQNPCSVNKSSTTKNLNASEEIVSCGLSFSVF